MKLTTKHKAYILGMYAFLLLVHFVIKDRLHPISVIYYTFPLLILIILGTLIAFLYLKKRNSFLSIIAFQIILCFIWFNNYYAFAEKLPNQKSTHNILFWNVAKKQQLPLDILIDKINTETIENIALVEALHVSEKEIETLKIQLPNFNFKKLNGNMFFGTKNKINSVKYSTEEESFKANLIEITGRKNYKVLIIDVYANPFYNRAKPLDSIFQIIKENNVNVIVGDFNIPFNSVHFNAFKSVLKPFHKFSKGATATWAYGFPLLELDHIWLNEKFKPIQLKKFQHKNSDHQLLIAKYTEN